MDTGGVADEYEGQTISGRYLIERKIGEGGMGKVYRARVISTPGDSNPVALKILRRDFLSDKNALARFRRELRVTSRLRHPNSIGVLDSGNAPDGALYIAMEWVAGKDLHTVLAESSPFPELRAARIVAQILSALGAAHRLGIIHRDLKPENVMIATGPDGEDRVKVLDFGIAKIQPQGEGEELTALTQAGFVCGTPEYMSPEQARGTPLDARSDLYSVGVLLYQMVTGALPFEGQSSQALAAKHLYDPPPPLSTRSPGRAVSAPLEALILKALAKPRNGRPRNAERFRDELLRAVGLKRPDELTRTAVRMGLAYGAKRRPLRLAALAVGAVMLAGLIALALRRPTARPEPTPVALPEASGVAIHPKVDSVALERQGDEAVWLGDLPLAWARYQEAYAERPSSDLSLKLGELGFRRRKFTEARRYWESHLRQRPHSRAAPYIRQLFSDL